MEPLCMPSLLFLVFGATHVIVNAYSGMYNLAFINIWITLLVTLVLNVLCKNDLSLVAWFLVSLPFLFMTLVASLLLFVFGLNPTTGKAVTPPTF